MKTILVVGVGLLIVAAAVTLLRSDGSETVTTTASLGSEGEPLRVSILSYTGYAPGIVANGGELTTQKGSVFERSGLHVAFAIHDDAPPTLEVLEARGQHCVLRTLDMWAWDYHSMVRQQVRPARMVAVVARSVGADAIVTKAGIEKIENLADPNISVMLVPFTPSHFLLWHAVQGSSMSSRAKHDILERVTKFDSPVDILSALESRESIEAAVLWDPFMTQALETSSVTGLDSTKDYPKLIYDGIICKADVLEDHPTVVKRLVDGWFDGIEAATADKARARQALVQTMPYFAGLQKERGEDFVEDLFDRVKWTGRDENLALIREPGGNGPDVWERAQNFYAECGKDKPTARFRDAFASRALVAPAEQRSKAEPKGGSSP